MKAVQIKLRTAILCPDWSGSSVLTRNRTIDSVRLSVRPSVSVSGALSESGPGGRAEALPSGAALFPMFSPLLLLFTTLIVTLTFPLVFFFLF